MEFMIVGCIFCVCAVTSYAVQKYFDLKYKELEAKNPKNVGASLEDLSEVVLKVDALEKKINPLVIMKNNRDIFRSSR